MNILKGSGSKTNSEKSKSKNDLSDDLDNESTNNKRKAKHSKNKKEKRPKKDYQLPKNTSAEKVPELYDETGGKFNQSYQQYNELEQFFNVASSTVVNENLLDMLAVTALENLYTLTPKCHETDKLGEIYRHFFDAKNNLHMRSELKELFRLLDSGRGTEWPNKFINFIDKQTASKISRTKQQKKGNSHNKVGGNGFASDNPDQLAWAKRIQALGTAAKLEINSFLNPQWTTDYGSGGNESGHLLMMRKHYYCIDYVPSKTVINVNAAVRRTNKKTPGKSKYRVTSESSAKEIEAEIERQKAIMIAEFDNTWYPSCWLTFYLFGKPQHGTKECYTILKSGVANDDVVEKSPEERRTELADLNVEAGNKNLRRANRKSDSKDNEESVVVEAKKVTVTHQFIAENKGPSAIEKLEKALALLEKGYLESDDDEDVETSEQPKFSVRKEKKRVSREMYKMLTDH